MQITEKLRTKIISHLPKGYAKEIAARCGVSEVTVYRVLHHKQNNLRVAEALINLAVETKQSMTVKHKQLLKTARQL